MPWYSFSPQTGQGTLSDLSDLLSDPLPVILDLLLYLFCFALLYLRKLLLP